MKRILWLLSVSLVCSLASFAKQNVEIPGNSNESKSGSNLQGIYVGGGLGLTLRSFRTFDAVPYLRLKACYTFQ